MERHKLFLEFPYSTNEGILKVEDSSIYSTFIPVSCNTLEITPPGFSTATVFTNLSSGFRLFLNACDLGFVGNCNFTCPTLPDGIYNYRYSVSPNSQVFVEYKQLRITQLKNAWYKVLCWVNNKPCDPTNETLTVLRQLQLLENHIETAKHLVEDKHQYEEGVEIYRYAQKKVEELSQGCHFC